jgi:8-oxo-dGTP pyrophosphatase MutT (NUDIX family)
MSRPRRWSTLGTETLQDCNVFRVSRALVESPNTGKSHSFYRIDSVDWVNVVPVTAAGEIVMVRQYRHGLRDLTLEIPGGMIDSGETPEQAAARELLEETGYRAASLTPLGSVNPNPALFGNRLFAFLAHGCERVGEVANESTEETVVELVPEPALRRLVREGRVDHALVLATLLYLDLAREEGLRDGG